MRASPPCAPTERCSTALVVSASAAARELRRSSKHFDVQSSVARYDERFSIDAPMMRSADEITTLRFYDGEHGFGTEGTETITDSKVLNLSILFKFDAVNPSISQGRGLEVIANASIQRM